MVKRSVLDGPPGSNRRGGRPLPGARGFARGALGLASAADRPFAVWLNGWSVRSEGAVAGCGGCFRARLSASDGDIALSLRLEATRTPVLQGEHGYSIKTGDGRAASYYYSMPGIKTAGRLALDGETFQVSGESWMDREWSSAVLAPGQSGWDWFSLNLDNANRLTLFRVRENGRAPHVSATLIQPDGAPVSLDSADLVLTPVRYWTSPETGARYPVAWRLEGNSPSGRWDLSIAVEIDAQELDLAFHYYEGLVEIVGQWDGEAVEGWATSS